MVCGVRIYVRMCECIGGSMNKLFPFWYRDYAMHISIIFQKVVDSTKAHSRDYIFLLKNAVEQKSEK